MVVQVSLVKAVIGVAIVGVLLTLPAGAQQRVDGADSDAPPPVAASLSDKLPHPNERYFLKNLVIDQKNIWTSPARIQPDDAKWLVPSVGIATGLLVTDPDSSFGIASYHPNTWKEVSNYGLGAVLGTTGAMYLWGHITNNDRARETGVLATEAMLDALPLPYAI